MIDPEAGTTVWACAAVVLAAGAARRFGEPKLRMPFGESTVIGSVVHSLHLAGTGPIIVVAGANSESMTDALPAFCARVVCNQDPSGGMVSSIRIGVAALPPSAERFLIALGDQPRIRPEGIGYLVHQHVMSGKGIALPTCDGKRGHPIVFRSEYRREILALSEGQTLRDVINLHRDDILEVECGSDAYVCDIDTREDYEWELQRWRHGG